MAVKVKNDRGLFTNINTGQEFAAYQWRGTLDSLYDIAAWIGAMPMIAKLPAKDGYSLIMPDQVAIGEKAGASIRYEISRIADKGDWICWTKDLVYRVVDQKRFSYDYERLRRPF